MSRKRQAFGLAGTHNDPRRGWDVSLTYTLPDGRTVSEGDEAELSGARGKYRFRQHVVTSTSEWLDFVGAGEQGVFMSVRADRVRRVFPK